MTDVDHDYVDWFFSHDWVPYDGSPRSVWIVPAGGDCMRMVPVSLICSSCGWKTADPTSGKPSITFSSWHCGAVVALEVLES